MRRPLLIALLALGIAPATASGALPRDFAGIVDSHDPGPAELERMSEATGLFRSNLYWPAVEPFVPGQRNWLRYDTLIGNAARAGLRTMATVYGSPGWASARPEYPPDADHLDEFADFTEALVERYGEGGDFWEENPDLPELPVRSWEIWNEPNNPTFWLPQPTAAQYARVLAAAAEGMRRADEDAEVVLGGLFPAAYSANGVAMPEFLEGLYALGAADDFDAVAAHPYARNPAISLETIERTREIMDSNGDSATPIWVTEVGWATSGERSTVTVSERTQARYLRVLLSRASARRERLGLSGVFWFYFRDRPPVYWASRTGLLRVDGSEKPSWRALVRLGDLDSAAGPSVLDGVGGAVLELVTELVDDSIEAVDGGVQQRRDQEEGDQGDG